MTMEFTGEFDSERPREDLWSYFTDPDIIAECAPGMEEMNQLSEHEFEAVITVGVGSVKPTFNVDAVVTEADRPNRLVLKTDGSGGRKGAFEGIGSMDMIERDDGGTTLEWTAEANVSGIIASLGQRALGSVTHRLVGQFFEAMETKIEEGEDATSRMSAKPDAEAELGG